MKAVAAWVLAIVVVAVIAALLLRSKEPASSADVTPGDAPTERVVDAAPDRNAPSPQPHASAASQPSVDAEFMRRARSADVRKLLQDPELPDEVIAALLDTRVSETALTLERAAQSGNVASNVTLARLQDYCTDEIETAEATPPGTSESTGPRDAAVASVGGNAEDFRHALREACRQATFEKNAIDRRLRQAANDGDAASLYLLGARARDLNSRRSLWMSAAMLGDLQAQLNLVNLLTSESISAGRGRGEGANFWLAVAANRSPAAQASLAQCRVRGCDGQPADVVVARDHLRSAATQGDAQALESLYQASTAAEFEMPGDEVYAWARFHHRLLAQGCYGAMEYAKRSQVAEQGVETLGTQLSPFALENGRKLADQYWQEFGAQARRAQRCN